MTVLDVQSWPTCVSPRLRLAGHERLRPALPEACIVVILNDFS